MRSGCLLLTLVSFLGCGGSDSATSGVPGKSPVLGDCPLFPPDNPWNLDVSNVPVDPRSADYLATMGLSTGLHADFGSNLAYGIPITSVTSAQPRVPITFDYARESDPGPYPIPDTVAIEGGGDRHAILVEATSCLLYEVYALERVTGGWHGGSGAVWPLRENRVRPSGYTSADAAGLPILPGLVRYEEVAAGEIAHALRFTASRTQNGFVSPATHAASSSTDPTRPPMGMRVRLRGSFDVSSFPARIQVMLRAMQRHGMLLADNGSSWYVSGTSDTRWDDDELQTLRRVHGSDFEVLLTGPITPQPE